VGTSLRRGTEGAFCRPDPTHREVCCLPAARVRDIARKLPNLVCPSDYYSLLIVQAGSDNIEERSLKTIKRDFRGLGRLVDGAGVQVVFSSIPMVTGRGTDRTWKAHLIKPSLRGWYQHRNFVFFDHEALYLAPSLMAADRSLSLRGKWILGQELAGLIERALNLVRRGTGLKQGLLELCQGEQWQGWERRQWLS